MAHFPWMGYPPRRTPPQDRTSGLQGAAQGLGDLALFGIPEIGVHGQAEHPRGGMLRHRQFSRSRPDPGEGRLQIERDGLVDRRGNT